MDGGAWWAAVREVNRSQTQLSDFTFTFHFHALEKEMAIHSSVLFFFFLHFLLLYNTVLVLPYIDMNLPWVYMSSQS